MITDDAPTTTTLSDELRKHAKALTAGARNSGTYGDLEALAHATARALRALAVKHDHA